MPCQCRLRLSDMQPLSRKRLNQSPPMQIASTKLLRLLDADQALEVRCAAALVLGEIGVKDTTVSKVLCECLQDEAPALRLAVIKTIGKLKIEPALPQLVARVEKGGEEAELAAHAAARLGPKGTAALQDLMHRVAPGVRRYIAAALASGGTASAGNATLAVLVDRDANVVEAAVRSLIGQIPSLSAAQKKAWADHILQLADRKKNKTPLAPVSEAAVVRLLAALDDPRGGTVLWDRILPPHPLEVRAASLQALGKWAEAPNKEQLKRLFTCAAERDFRIAAPALAILNHLTVNERSLTEWLSLFEAPDVAVRRMALEKLGDRDSATVAEALLKQLNHSDRALREAALARLTKLEQGRKALTAALFDAENVDRAWQMAKAQASFVKDYPAKWREEVFDKACTYLEASDRRADALLFLLREAEPAELRDRLEQRALACRKKKAYATALLYLRLLGRDPACGFAIRLELAACGLKTSGKDLAADGRNADPCLQQFVHLGQQDDGQLFEQLEKMKWLEPEDLYYLGFHLAEQQGRPRKIAEQVLHLVVKRSPRSKLGQAAKSKLRSAGLE
jgi:HEAT repeat protein